MHCDRLQDRTKAPSSSRRRRDRRLRLRRDRRCSLTGHARPVRLVLLGRVPAVVVQRVDVDVFDLAEGGGVNKREAGDGEGRRGPTKRQPSSLTTVGRVRVSASRCCNHMAASTAHEARRFGRSSKEQAREHGAGRTVKVDGVSRERVPVPCGVDRPPPELDRVLVRQVVVVTSVRA